MPGLSAPKPRKNEDAFLWIGLGLLTLLIYKGMFLIYFAATSFVGYPMIQFTIKKIGMEKTILGMFIENLFCAFVSGTMVLILLLARQKQDKQNLSQNRRVYQKEFY